MLVHKTFLKIKHSTVIRRFVNLFAQFLLLFALTICASSVSFSEQTGMRQFFRLDGSDIPTAWANPPVPIFYDQTGLHPEIFDEILVLTQMYSYATDVEAFRPSGEASFPSLGFVIAENALEFGANSSDHIMNPKLSDSLNLLWRGFPVQSAIDELVTPNRAGNVRDGEDCTVFISQDQSSEGERSSEVRAAVIIANSSLPKRKILQCFYNKTALSFGLAVSNFDFERQYDLREDNILYFGAYPFLIGASDLCRSAPVDQVFLCIENIFFNTLLIGLNMISETEIISEIIEPQLNIFWTAKNSNLNEPMLSSVSASQLLFRRYDSMFNVNRLALNSGLSPNSIYSRLTPLVAIYDAQGRLVRNDENLEVDFGDEISDSGNACNRIFATGLPPENIDAFESQLVGVRFDSMEFLSQCLKLNFLGPDSSLSSDLSLLPGFPEEVQLDYLRRAVIPFVHNAYGSCGGEAVEQVHLCVVQSFETLRNYFAQVLSS